ncbi:hypothetical protein [Pseudomonas sp. v388]|uniref:hypothetical protein n=1 Tax=Pseudomonas sp. v388 TaxID=2479849 RepID=UPI000F7A84AB|nr:hypothetical protein [Pseudomonas sp. v388]
MKSIAKPRNTPKIRADELATYPDVEYLVSHGDLMKIGAGYSVQTEAGFDAISPYIVGLTIGRDGKPTVYRLARRKI